MTGVIQSGRFGAVGGTPSYVGSTSGNPASGTTDITVTPHASTATGNLIVLAIFIDGTGGTIDVPSGWTGSSYIANPDLYLLYRTHDGSASYAITRSVSTPTCLYLAASFASAVWDVVAVSSPTFNGTPVMPSVTPTATAILFGGWGIDQADDASVVPVAFTDIPDTAAGGMATEFGYTAATYPASATGTFTASANFASARQWRTFTVALKG